MAGFGLNENINHSQAIMIVIVVTVSAFVFLIFPQILVVIIVSAILIKIFSKGINSLFIPQERVDRRQNALLMASPFLAPYSDIWRDLKLSNRYCSLYLEKDGVLIKGKEKGGHNRSFRVVTSKEYDYKDIWDMFCLTFSYELTYEDLIRLCGSYKLTIMEENNFVYKPKENLSKVKGIKFIEVGDLNVKKGLKPEDDSKKLFG